VAPSAGVTLVTTVVHASVSVSGVGVGVGIGVGVAAVRRIVLVALAREQPASARIIMILLLQEIRSLGGLSCYDRPRTTDARTRRRR
jgi:hypothetical protein